MPTDAISLSYIEQYEGKVVPFSFNAGYVGLSYVVSLVGAASTLELIRRRTSHKGIYNLLLLAGAATCMGGIAIWSMHYVGNRAITMLDGAEGLQIAYATKFTILSFFMPILVLLVAFVVATAGARAVWWRVYVSGFLSGSAICGMHYIGDLSISNYRTAYHVAYVVGAALIAVSASSAALALFFIFEAAWTNAWWKRAGCAMVLAGAVSGMHWCAAVGTEYVLVASPSGALHGDGGGGSMSRTDTTIIVSCLSIVACAIITSSIAVSTYMRRASAVKAQKVVLASAVFDQRGRIMVSYEGLIPSQVLTTAFIPKTSSEFFDTAHPIFHWMFRASRSWASVASLIDPMQSHMGKLSQNSKLGLVGDDGVLVSNYNTVICEMFCLAAAGLASLMKDSILDAGKLWDEILTTGGDTNSSNHRPRTPASAAASPSLRDDSASEKGLENSSTDHGRGSLMFLVRHARTNDEVERLKAEGYRFAEIHQVIGNIRSNMQILTPDLLGCLTRMAELGPSVDCGYAPGVYVGAFVLRARLDPNNSGGFDVLVQKDARHRLPALPITVQHLQECHRDYLKQLHGLTASAIIQRLSDGFTTSNNNEKNWDEASFSKQILQALTTLRDAFNQTTGSDGLKYSPFDNAVLIPQVTQLPCRAEPASKDNDKERDGGVRKTQYASTSSLICFRLVLPIHARHTFKEYQFDPLPLFRTRQLVYPGSPQQVGFSHQIHQEVMASVLQDVPLSSPGSLPQPRLYLGKLASLVGLNKKRNHADGGAMALQQLERSSREGLTHPSMSHISHDEQSSELGDRKQSVASLYAVASNDHSAMHARQFGGIMVSQQVVVGIEERDATRKDTANGARISVVPAEQTNLSPQIDTSYTAVATASDGKDDGSRANGQQTETVFVDELFRLCMDGYVAR